jgi:glycosyltransferase involved in cell wall biosynthesis
MHFCLIYDCLYPWTVGGAERWYRNLADELVRAGHEVTYLTRRQWDEGEPPCIPGVRVVAVSPPDMLYDAAGARRTLPPLRFGRGVLGHLLRHRGRYDAVHTCAFPYFSLLAARAALAGTGVPVAVDWFEVWTRAYWRAYAGPLIGTAGAVVQRLCVLLTPHAFVFSRLHAERLKAAGLRSPAKVLAGLYAGPLARRGDPRAPREPLALFAGRHIPEKRVTALPAAVAAARRDGWPELRALVLGDGPERDALLAEVRVHALDDAVEVPGFVAAEEVETAFARAACLVLPSVREGYGLVVIEAAAAGTPSVVVRAPDNAAVELVEEGVNGTVADSPEPEALAAALRRVRDGGEALRERTAAWFDEHAPHLTAAASARLVLAGYASARR